MSEQYRVLSIATNRLKRGWCQGQFAENAAGKATDVCSADAQRWCVMGAIRAVTNKMDDIQEAELLYRSCISLIEERLQTSVGQFNDSSGTSKGHIIFLMEEVIDGIRPKES